MANCDLSIQLDPTRNDDTYDGGETIRGIVVVHVDKDVNCNGLEIRTRWATHGRGNVDAGVVDSKTIDPGQWIAGQTKEYPFELTVGGWPPTYHGHHLNVDHYVEARAKIPWGFDPKASAPFRVHPTKQSDKVIGKSNVIELKGPIAAMVAAVIAFGFVGIGVAVAANFGWFMLPFLLLLPLAIGIFALFRFVLPKWALGEVESLIDTEHVAPGQEINGEITIQPKKNISINAITLTLSAEERCVSGSGSNRTTHKHQLFDQTYAVVDSTTLRPNEKHRFPLKFQLPPNAPYSLDLDDNDLIWTANINVDIPRWPDWRKSLPLRVVPSGKSSDDPVAERRTPPVAASPVSQAQPAAAEITFAETARHLWSVREDSEQTEMLVEAVTGLTFEMQAIVERRLLYAGEDDPHLFKNGYAIWAHSLDPQLPMVLYVPHELADEFEQMGREAWHGRGTIVGWDKRHGRLQVKLEYT